MPEGTFAGNYWGRIAISVSGSGDKVAKQRTISTQNRETDKRWVPIVAQGRIPRLSTIEKRYLRTPVKIQSPVQRLRTQEGRSWWRRTNQGWLCKCSVSYANFLDSHTVLTRDCVLCPNTRPNMSIMWVQNMITSTLTQIPAPPSQVQSIGSSYKELYPKTISHNQDQSLVSSHPRTEQLRTQIVPSIKVLSPMILNNADIQYSQCYDRTHLRSIARTPSL